MADATTQLRFEAWSRAWQSFQENPIFGSGLEIGPPLQYPHNVIVEALMATGIVGVTIFSIILFLAFRAGRRIVLHRPQVGWLTLLMVQYVAGALVSGTVYSNSVMWMMLAACVASASHPHHAVTCTPKVAQS